MATSVYVAEMQSTVQTDRRHDARIPVSLRVLALDGRTASRRRAVSLSASALMLEGAPDSPGSIMQLELSVPGRSEPVWAAAEVLPVARRGGSVVRFKQMAETDRMAIEEFLSRRLSPRPRERVVAGEVEIDRPGD
jgi:hypothetical protein